MFILLPTESTKNRGFVDRFQHNLYGLLFAGRVTFWATRCIIAFRRSLSAFYSRTW